jgi:hypothetical protein
MRAKWIIRVLPMLVLGVPSGAAERTATTATQCDRTCLVKVLDSFFESLARQDPARLSTTHAVRFTFNGAPTAYGQELWQHFGAASYRLDAIDPGSGQVAANAVIGDHDHKSILFVRLKVTTAKVDEIEVTLVRPGEGQRSNPEALTGQPSVYQEVVTQAQCTPRAQLIAAAEAYFQGIADAGTAQYKSPPLAPDMVRVENGIQAGRRAGSDPVPSIDEQLRHGFGQDKLYVSERRYPVVDEEHGIVVAIGLMHVDRPPGPPPPLLVGAHSVDSPHLRQILVEFFKVQDGTIRQIQATMYDLNNPKTTGTGWSNTASDSPASHAR